jgi:hypothetical protein
MSITLDTPPADEPLIGLEPLAGPDDATVPDGSPDHPSVPRDEEPAVNPLLTSLSAFLSASAAGWLAGGLFDGFFPRLVGLLGAAIGAGMVALSYRVRRTALVQYLGIAVAALAGALLVMPDAGSGSANLPSLVLEAARTGGIGAPPVPFVPGWRFILVVFIAVLAGGSAAAAVGLNKPKVAAFVPLPVIFGAALLQPTAVNAAFTAVAVGLVPAALTVSHGAQLVQEGSTSGRFEVRRLVRSGLVVLLTMILLVVLSALGLFLPKPSDSTVVPPQRPQPPPSQPDHRIFTVKTDRKVPWRLGVLDGYDGKGWLLPPFDPASLLSIPDSGVVPAAAEPTPAKPGRATFDVTFTVTDMQGAVAPTVASATTVEHRDFAVKIDPRVQNLRLPKGRVPSGTTYRITAAVPPSATELISAKPPSAAMGEFLQAPAPPEDVVTMLGKAPTTNLFDRLQFVRDALYRKVVAAGGGKPVDVPPQRVVAMLGGADASPFEITAAEVLLARWAGVPARIGYGYYGGDRVGNAKDHVFEIRPKHGATWLEAWFDGYGWVPLVGVPNKAKASLNQEKQDRPDVHPSEQVALAAYVPVRVSSVRLLFELVRYWLVRAGGLLLLVGLLWWSSAGVVKQIRRAVRARWARRRGPLAEVLVAYGELRDRANDLNIGNPYDSPIEFLALIEPDAEHAELAWLVTRALWGDLQRGVLPEDARLAREMARSVEKRLAQAQPGVTRTIAFGSRTSLRAPYTTDIPNLWPARLVRGRLRRPSLRGALTLLRPAGLWAALLSLRGLPAALARTARAISEHRRQVLAAALAVIVVASAVGGLVLSSTGGSGRESLAEPALPTRTVPAKLGDLVFKRELKLEAGFARAGSAALVNPGVIYSIRRGDEVLGSIQLAPFKAAFLRSDDDLDDVRGGVVKGIGTGSFTPVRAGTDVVLKQRGLRTGLFLWFAPDTSYFELLVAGRELDQPEMVMAALLAYQRGQEPASAGTGVIQQLDARRGGVE